MTRGAAARSPPARSRPVSSAVAGRPGWPSAQPVGAGGGGRRVARAGEVRGGGGGAGADAILAWPPPGCDDLVGYYAELGRVADGLPVLAYHIPWISSPGIPVSALAGLPVAGLKDSSGDPDRLLAEVAHYPGRTYVGSSALLALAGPIA